MANIKRYLVEHEPTCGDIYVDIDHYFTIEHEGKTITVEELMRDQLSFFTSGEKLLQRCDGDVLKAYLLFVCKRAMQVGANQNLNHYGIISAFAEEEGHMPIDGSRGVNLVGYSAPDFNVYDEYKITILP